MSTQSLWQAPQFNVSGMFDDISNADYHNSKGVSSSVLKAFSECPFKCHARYFSGEVKSGSSAALIFGSAYHKYVLEQATFNEEFAVNPPVSASTADFKYFRDNSAGKQVIADADFRKIQAMAKVLWESPQVRALLSGGKAEQSIYWQDEESGEQCKVRPDYRTNNHIVDLKTCRDASPQGFSRDMAKYGYHKSAAWYLDGDAIVNGTDHETFILIAQEKEPPYAFGIYPVGDLSLERGRQSNRKALNGIAECKQTGVWPSYQAQELDIPAWALNQSEDDE